MGATKKLLGIVVIAFICVSAAANLVTPINIGASVVTKACNKF